MPAREKVVVLGASPDRERYSNKAQKLLTEHGHQVVPVSPLYDEVDGVKVLRSLGEVGGPVDTLTLYLSPKRLSPLAADIVKLHPGRVIFNPGTETPALQQALTEAGIPWIEACTLVMLRTGQY